MVSDTVFHVEARWDADAGRWVSVSDIQGLHIETDTLDAFRDLVAAFGPELVAVNHYGLPESRAGEFLDRIEFRVALAAA
jgi:hypothetical protein